MFKKKKKPENKQMNKNQPENKLSNFMTKT